MTQDERRPGITRRGMLAGAGAVVAAAGLTRIPTAEAAPAPASSEGVGLAGGVHPDGSPITTTIGSAPISGLVYKYVDMYEFRPFNPASQPTWGGNGTYSAGSATAMRASVDVPPGARLVDVEWYVYNNSASTVYGSVYLSVAGQGTISSVGADASFAPSTARIAASRVTAPSTGNGPYPLSSKLMPSLSTPTDGTVQINGVRLGFQQGNAGIGLLAAPHRVYDSRNTGGKLAANSTRTITLPANLIAPGVTGILVNITAVGASGDGYLTAYPTGAARPGSSTINYPAAAAIANMVVVGLSSNRQFTVYTNASTHVIVDLTGTIS